MNVKKGKCVKSYDSILPNNITVPETLQSANCDVRTDLCCVDLTLQMSDITVASDITDCISKAAVVGHVFITTYYL